MIKTILGLILVLQLITFKAEANASAFLFFENDCVVLSIDSLNSEEHSKKYIFKKKATAIGIAIALGPLGMHRLYLGTDYRVPVFYALTLGAFGIIPLIDIIAIATIKDISQLENNPRIVLWIK